MIKYNGLATFTIGASMRTHPQSSVDAILQESAKEQSSSLKQRVADSTLTIGTRLPANVWSIKIPKVYMEGTELAHGKFEHVMFVSGAKAQIRKVAKIVTGLNERKEREDRPNWIVSKDTGTEYVIDAQKFLVNARVRAK